MLEVRCNAAMGSLAIDADFLAAKPWTVLFGPSGSGKSSLLRLIAGLWQPQNSRVIVDKRDLSKTPTHLRRIALVAQQPALFPHLNVRRNILFAMATRPAPALRNVAKQYEAADELLLRLRVPHAGTHMPRELSGGEVKRVAIARALAMQPNLLMLDEVFTGMDAALALDLRAELRCWQRATGTPILSVTHDISEALSADEVLRIEAGRVTAQGDAAVVLEADRNEVLRALTSQGML